MYLEKRRERRFPVARSFLFRCLSETPPELVGLAYNASDSGAAFFCPSHLEVGSSIRILSGAFPDVPKTARVIWCSKVEDNIFRAGVTLT